MAKKTSSMRTQDLYQEGTSILPPFSREAFHEDVISTFLFPVRMIAVMTDEPTAWRIIRKTVKPEVDEYALLHQAGFDNSGVSYEEIAHTEFVEALEAMYNLAYFSIIDESKEEMNDESVYTRTAAILCDLGSSSYVEEWGSYNGSWEESVKRCIRVAETANAKLLLEGEKAFFYFLKGSIDEEGGGEASLTVHQMALLADMEEMSIRAAANPKRANPLATFSENGRTRIASDVAREWLKSKGRYVPISREWSAGKIDLEKTRFFYPDELLRVLADRCEMLFNAGTNEELQSSLENIGFKLSYPERRLMLDIDRSLLSVESVMRTVAALLDLPADLLVLRMREAILREELAMIERQLRATTS